MSSERVDQRSGDFEKGNEMAIIPNDYIDPELQDLVGGSSVTELARSLRPTPEFVIDADPLAELPLGTEDPPTETTFEKVERDIEMRKRTCKETSETLSLGKLPLVEVSRQAYLEGMVDAMRHRRAFKTIKNSEVWTTLVQACSDFVDAQVADAAR